jgi:hypothetical protein
MGEDFYSFPSISTELLNHLFHDPTSLTHHHWKLLLLLVLRPLIVECPPAAYESCLTPLLPPLFEFITKRLDKDWKPIVVPESIESSETEEISEEILKEKFLRMCTRALADLLSQLFQTLPQKKENKDVNFNWESFKTPLLAQYLVNSPVSFFLFLLFNRLF